MGANAVRNGVKCALATMVAKGLVKAVASASLNFLKGCFHLTMIVLAFTGLDSENSAMQPLFGLFGEFGKCLFVGLMTATILTGTLLSLRYPTKAAFSLAPLSGRITGLAALTMEKCCKLVQLGTLLAYAVI